MGGIFSLEREPDAVTLNRKDPKVGGGVGGTCKVTKDQNQHSPSDFGSSDVASFGSSDVAIFVSSDVASFGSSDVASFDSSDVANFGSSYVESFGSSDVANFGSSYPPTPPSPRERTLREMVAPDFTYDSLCIQYEDVPYVLKTGLIHLLPKFNGLAGQDPHKHLKEFHIVCSTMKPHDVMEDHICLKAFPHSLEGPAKDWLYYLAPSSITSWGDLKRSFLGKFFPASRTIAIRKDISGIRQQHGESFIIDVASGGAVGDMTPFEARCLIEKMASNSQQFNAWSGDAIVAPDWISPFNLECDIVVYALGTVLSSYDFDFPPP
ncbi:hypothetical protein Lal_00013508 [Lupinus albus]|nr:hypothetical protein Lal_00013508 [Lupinus albus]